MNGKKWVIIAVIAVAVLFLAAAVLSAVLVFKTIDELEYRNDSRYEQREEEEEEEEEEERPARREEEETVAEEVPAVEPPAEEAPMEGLAMALVIPDNGEFSAMMMESFYATCAQLGAEPLIMPTGGTPEEAFEMAMMMLESGVSAIAVSCPEPGLLEELSMVAMEMGVVLVSLDVQEDVYLDVPVQLRIEAWGSVTDIANVLLQEMAYGIGMEGKFGVVAPNSEDPVFDAMESFMGQLDEVKKTVWKASGHGDGDFQSCYDSVTYMLDRYALDAIICTDPMTTQAAAQVITECGYDVKLYGYAPPSAVEGYLPDGVVVYHNPLEMGELVARAMDGILNGTLTMEMDSGLFLENGNYYRLYLFDGILDFFVTPLYINAESIDDLYTWY